MNTEVQLLLQNLLSQNVKDSKKKDDPAVQLTQSILQLVSSGEIKEITVPLQPNQQCIVLGMHRSGTSALSGILNLMGLFVGESTELLTAADDNVKGYFERTDVVKLNAILLGSLKANWYNGLDTFYPEHLKHDVISEFRIRASRIIEQLEQSKKPWQIKDPRMCLTSPAWRKLIPSPIVILAYRHPIEVATSLFRRNKFPMEFGLALWEKYTVLSIQHSIGLPRIILSYHDLIADPIKTTARLHQELTAKGMNGLCIPPAEQIQEFVDPKLNHSSKNRDESLLTSNQKLLFTALQDGTALKWNENELPQLSEDALKILHQEH